MQERDKSPKAHQPHQELDKASIQTKVHDALKTINQITGMSPAESGAILEVSTLPPIDRDIRREVMALKFESIARFAISDFARDAIAEHMNPAESPNFATFKRFAA